MCSRRVCYDQLFDGRGLGRQATAKATCNAAAKAAVQHQSAAEICIKDLTVKTRAHNASYKLRSTPEFVRKRYDGKVNGTRLMTNKEKQ